MNDLDVSTVEVCRLVELEMCGATGTADVIDASVVLVARGHNGVVLTSDADAMRRIDARLDLVEC